MIKSEIIERILDEHRRNLEAKEVKRFGPTERRADVVRRARQKVEALKVFTSDELALLWPESCGQYMEDWSDVHDVVFFNCPVVDGLKIRVQFEERTENLYSDLEDDFGIYIDSEPMEEMHYLSGHVDREAVVEMIAQTIEVSRVREQAQ